MLKLEPFKQQIFKNIIIKTITFCPAGVTKAFVMLKLIVQCLIIPSMGHFTSTFISSLLD